MKTILFIDDQIDNILSIEAVIKSNNSDYNILRSLSGKDGFNLALEKTPDTILLDIVMPEMDGFQTCKQLKDTEETKHIPIILISANKIDSKSRTLGLSIGADAFLTKPFDPDELMAQINVMLRIKEAEDKLRLENLRLESKIDVSEAKYKALYENVPVPYQSLDKNGCFIDVNPTWLNTLGYERDEVIGEKFQYFLHPDWSHHFNSNFTEFKKKGCVSGIEYKMKHKKGHYIDISFDGCIGYNPDGSYKQSYCVFHDISERKLKEQEVIDSEYKFRLIADNTSDFEYWIDENGKYVYLSESCKNVTGYSPEDYIKSPQLLQELVLSDYSDTVNHHYEKEREHKPTSKLEFEIKHKDGSVRWIEHNCQKVVDKEGNYRGRRGANRDITDRKKAEIELKNREFFLNETSELAKVGGWEIDLIDNTLAWTDETFRIHELDFSQQPDVEEAINFYHPEDRERVSELVSRAVSNNEPFDFEARLITGKENIIWVRAIGNAVFDKGNPISIKGIIQDITINKQNESELIKAKTKAEFNENELKKAQKLAHIGSWYLDVKTNEVIWSEELFRMYGFDPKLPVPPYTEHMKLFTPESWELLSTSLERTSTEGIPYELELETVKKDGTNGWMWVRGEAIKNDKGVITNLWGAAQDITERKSVEQTLKESEEKYKLIAENTSDVVWIVDFESGRFRYISPSIMQLRGYTKEEALLLSIEDALTPESLEYINSKVDDRIKRFKQGKEEEFVDVLEQYRKDGSTIWTEVKARYVKNNSTGKIEIVGVTRDISEQKKYQMDLIKTRDLALESDRLKSIFLATMSHELRTPLNSIIGFSDIIEKDTSIEDILHYNDIINNSGNHLLGIVENLFDLTLIESGETKLNKKSVKLMSIIKEVHNVIKIEQQQMNKGLIDLSYNINPNHENVSIRTDPQKLRQILINLLKNALKFTKIGSISYGFNIKENSDKQQIVFFVEDTGIGVKTEDQEFIFDNFRQVDESSTKEYGGTGIGLSISKKLIELLEGKIWIESELGKGSTFFFTIPYVSTNVITNNETKLQSVQKESIKFESNTILIVEDDDSSYAYLETLLRKTTTNIIRAVNGKEAVKLCEKEQEIDLILMDLNMPVMNGYIATREIKECNPNLPIIAQTAYAIAGDKEKALEAGCDDYISKPIKADVLFSKLRQYLS